MPYNTNVFNSDNMLAKLLAASGFRRGSYDDQGGDNDINIILQPSDLQDIEKRASYNSTAYGKAKEFGTRTNNNNNSNIISASKETNIADLKLAKSLLDQDYNLTVRLFTKKSALNWNFNSFTFDALCCGRSLTELLLHLFDYYNLYKIFNLDILNVLKCFRLLEFGYHSTNPYHNSIHAADVTQAMHCFIQEKKIRKHMTHLETLSSILAAVCHDLDHPGVNQTFLVATNNPLASLYDNNSVLENHHWRFALCIFKESQLFDHFENDLFEEMKMQLKHLILATDIARQNEYLRRFKDLTSSHGFSMQNIDDRALVLQMALKCADLGNPCRPWLISRVWSNLICDEFYKMGRIERQLGIPLTPICQREKTSIAGIQTDFFRFIVLPLLELWHRFLKSPLSSLLMSNFEHNYQRWQRANRIIQQLRRRKSVACIEPLKEVDVDCGGNGGCPGGGDDDEHAPLGLCSKQSYAAIKRASSDYVKSGNGNLELLRNFQLDRIIEKTPLLIESSFAKNHSKSHSKCAKMLMNVATESAKIMQTTTCNKIGKCAQKTGRQQPVRNIEKDDTSSFTAEQAHRSSRCAQGVNSSRNLANCSSYRKALSPIEDGDTSSPDQQQQIQDQGTSISCSTTSHTTTTTTVSAFPSGHKSGNLSSSASSSSISRASSACSSPVIQRSLSSRTSIDQLTGNSASNPHYIKNQQRAHFQHHPFLGKYYEPSGGTKIKPPNLTSVRESASVSSH